MEPVSSFLDHSKGMLSSVAAHCDSLEHVHSTLVAVASDCRSSLSSSASSASSKVSDSTVGDASQDGEDGGGISRYTHSLVVTYLTNIVQQEKQQKRALAKCTED
jgi:hypothetical protein